jgi:SAM-dependent methyltransferase
MALSGLEFNFLLEARARGLLPSGMRVLEFGESEAMNIDVCAALALAVPAGAQRDAMVAQALELKKAGTPDSRLQEARLLHRALFAPSQYTAIDLEPGPAHRIVQDLNLAFDLGRRFDLCINNGTSEHVFDQANFYKAIHDHTEPGGVMIHFTPCLGWVGHGLYNVQPGFFHDLARANEYEMPVAMLGTSAGYYDLPSTGFGEHVFQQYPALREAEACVLLRKKLDAPFRVPLQGTYANLKRPT